MKVLVVGSGGREHALAWKLAQSPYLDELHAAPGSPGIAALGECHPVRADDGEAQLALARGLPADLVVVGPEAPLVAGLADELRRAGIAVFGPSAAAARIEGSKSFAKDVMAAVGVPMTRRLDTPVAPCVVKADGLASGKGVFVCRDEAALEAALDKVAGYPGTPVFEELVEAEEISVFALAAGEHAIGLPPAQDYKRIGDGDQGPNTGGMGAYSPVPGLDAAEVEAIVDSVHRPVLAELGRRGTPFTGVLYAGLFRLPDGGVLVFEFNCRLGDPETQSILPRIEGDLLEAFAAAAAGELGGVELTAARAAVTVVLAAARYPDGQDAGTPIDGVADAERAGALVFHAGTALREGRLVTNGGRILNVTGVSDTLPDARARAYRAVELISFSGARYRSDIAAEVAPVGA